MRRRFILTALACFVGMAACYASASAHDYRYTERWYQAYERYRAAQERHRTRALERVYGAIERRRAVRERYRSASLDRRYNAAERYLADPYRYGSYAGYCDCPGGEYGYGRRAYGYDYGHFYGYHYHDYHHGYRHRRGWLHDRLWKRARMEGP